MSSISERNSEARKEFNRHLNAQETPLWFDGLFLVITDERVLSFRISSENLMTVGAELTDSYVLRLSIPLGMVSGITASSKKSSLGLGFVFSLKDGSTEFVGSPLAVESLEEVLAVIELAQRNPALSDSSAAFMKQERTISSREQRQVERDKSNSELEKKYGPEVISAGFAGLTITIFANGYVRLSAFLGLAAGEIEELLAISGGTDITKKTGLGRAAGAILTSGLSLGTPNQRGNVYLTISTNVDTYALSTESPTSAAIANMQAIVAAGTAALERAEATRKAKSAPVAPAQPSDLSAQLRNLAELKALGMLTDEEFTKAKSKLLEG